MAKKKKKSKNSFSEKYEVDKSKKRYQNPTKTRIGKILIVILAFAMIFGIVFSLIYAIVTKAFH